MPDGFLLVDKERGWTSHDVVAKCRGILRERKIGHAGTLDPMATGVLVVMVGVATKLAPFLTAQRKRYRAEVTSNGVKKTFPLPAALSPPHRW